MFREFWANWGGSREQDPGSVSRGLESGRGSAHFEGSGFYYLGFDDFNGMEYGVFKAPGHFQMKGSCFQTRLHFSCCFFISLMEVHFFSVFGQCGVNCSVLR